MRCPKGHINADQVIDSREVKTHAAIRRRRKCGICQTRWTTVELPAGESQIILRQANRIASVMGRVGALLRTIEKIGANTVNDEEWRALTQGAGSKDEQWD